MVPPAGSDEHAGGPASPALTSRPGGATLPEARGTLLPFGPPAMETAMEIRIEFCLI